MLVGLQKPVVEVTVDAFMSLRDNWRPSVITCSARLGAQLPVCRLRTSV